MGLLIGCIVAIIGFFWVTRKLERGWTKSPVPAKTRESTRKVVGTIAAAVAVAIAIGISLAENAWNEWQVRRHAEEVAAQHRAEREKLANDFATNKQSVLANAQSLLDQGKPQEAADYLTKYPSTEDPDARALLRRIASVKEQQRLAKEEEDRNHEISNTEAELKNVPETDTSRRLELYRRLSQLRPNTSTYEKKISFYEARQVAELRKQQAATKAAKRKQGVNIGMSKQDVLDSSWGRPEHVNTTVYSFGTQEQWVYGSGNYLYFKNDVLTSIQTGR